MFSFSALFNKRITQKELLSEFISFFSVSKEQVYICEDENNLYNFDENKIVFTVFLFNSGKIFNNIMNVDFRISNSSINHNNFLIEICKKFDCECYFEDNTINDYDPYSYYYIGKKYDVVKTSIPYEFID